MLPLLEVMLLRAWFRVIVVAFCGSFLSACGGGSSTIAPSSSGPIGEAPSAAQGANYKSACDNPAPGDDDICYALVRTDAGDAPNSAERGTLSTGLPSGYGPSQLQGAYGLATTAAADGAGQTVAVVESGDDPTAAADLAVYRTRYGLPACAGAPAGSTVGTCTFRKVGQSGSATSLPAENASWAEETSLDVDMISAICPKCNILIVEASAATTKDLEAAENTAVALGATEVSNSFGGSEYAASDAAYSHTGVVIVASAGDNGYAEGSTQPCSFASVVCVGGTSLQTASGARGFAETVWNDLSSSFGASGSGCSSLVTKPVWQTDAGCTRRSQSDVSFSADPAYGVAVYDSTSYEGYAGWLVFGGTSVGSPAIAATYALAGNASSLGPNAAKALWNGRGAGLNPITSGNNLASRGSCNRSYPYICTAGTSDDGVYSGPGGWGTPTGTSAF